MKHISKDYNQRKTIAPLYNIIEVSPVDFPGLFQALSWMTLGLGRNFHVIATSMASAKMVDPRATITTINAMSVLYYAVQKTLQTAVYRLI